MYVHYNHSRDDALQQNMVTVTTSSQVITVFSRPSTTGTNGAAPKFEAVQLRHNFAAFPDHVHPFFKILKLMLTCKQTCF